MISLFTLGLRLVIYAAMRTAVHLCWILASLLLTSPARAVVMIPLSIEEMTGRASLIVSGTVQSKSCQRDAAGRIFTRIELKVAEVWKGPPQNSLLQVVHGGGRLDGQEASVSGQVDYQPGEEIVGFFVLNDRGEAVTLGLAQGKFRVWKDEATGQKLAANLFHGRKQGVNAKASVSGSGESLTVERLKRRVEGVAR